MTEAALRETAANVRTHLLGLLRTFASPAEQRDYQRSVPFVPVPTELACGWADDLYHPDTAAHDLAFSSAERAALAGFDVEFRRWGEAVGGGDVEGFIASPAGAALARAAAVALEAFPEAPGAEPGAAPGAIGVGTHRSSDCSGGAGEFVVGGGGRRPMTESQWVGARRLDGPLRYVVTLGKHRKLRLLACAACDRVREHLINHNSRLALDTLMGCPDWELVANGVDRAFRPAQQAVAAVKADASEQRWYHLYESAAQALALGTGPELADHLGSALSSCRQARGLAAPPRDEPEAIASEEAHQLQLLRDIFGNLFSRDTIFRRWLTGTVSALAREMYEGHDYSAMPILADALQDAGCDSDEVLDHCRGPGPHVRGCWVVDMVLGKE